MSIYTNLIVMSDNFFTRSKDLHVLEIQLI